ncbi:MAG: hypothetical protein WAM48_04170 [Candidatus Sulfotelmatobacter sp.]
MKNLALIVVAAVVLLLLRTSVSAQDTSAVNVQTSCAHWAKVRVDKHKQFKGDSNDLYQTGVCLCGKAVDLNTCKTDERGLAVHESCYVARTVKSEPPQANHVLNS